MALFGDLPFQVFVHVFDHDDGGVDHGSYGDGDAAKTHDIRTDPKDPHGDEGHEDAHGKGEDDHQRATHMEEKHQTHEGHHDGLLDERPFQGVDGAQNQVRAVINRGQNHAGGEPSLDLGDLFLHPVDGGQSVFTEAHDHDSPYHITSTVQIGHPAADLGCEVDVGHVGYPDWGPGLGRSKDDRFDVGQIPDVAESPDHVFPLRHLQDHGSHVLVGAPDGIHDHMHGDAEPSKPIRIQGHLVGPLEPSDRSDLADPWGLT